MKDLLKCKVTVEEVFGDSSAEKETNTHIEIVFQQTQVQKDTKMQNQKHWNIISYRNHDDWPCPHHRHQDLLTRVYKELLLCVFRLQQNCLSCCCWWCWWCQVAFARRGEQKSGDDEDSAGDDDDDDVSITKSIFLRHPHCLKHQRDWGWFLPKKLHKLGQI